MACIVCIVSSLLDWITSQDCCDIEIDKRYRVDGGETIEIALLLSCCLLTQRSNGPWTFDHADFAEQSRL